MFENQSDLFSVLDELQLNSTDSSSYFNSSWSEDPQPYQSQDPRRDALYVVIPITILYSLILVSGVVGNISTCIVISRNKHMHTATNYYLFSLAVSDLLLLISGLPSEMYTIWSRYPYVFGETFCILTGYAAETSANATVLTITAFTVERYVAICHPFLSHTVSKLSRAFKFIIAIWLLALCFAVPQAIQFGVVVRSGNGTINEETAQCTIKNKFLEHAFEISTCVFFVAPMTLITVLYVLIGFKLRKSRLLKRPSLSNAAERQNNKNRNHVIRMLIAVVVAFFICWAPFHAQRLLAVYASSTTDHSDAILVIYNALTYISGILYYLSTTVNPVLYHIMSNKFREAFKGTLAQLCGGKHKDTLPGRTYSMLSRGATHTQLVGGHRSSLSCGAKDIPLHLQRLHRQTSVPVERNLPPIRINTLTQPMKPKQCSPINVLAKRLRLLPRTTGNHTSIDSANTISNSSLQDLDDPEFTGSELAHYMGELNNR